MAILKGHNVNKDDTTDLLFSTYPSPAEVKAACAGLGFTWDGGMESGSEGYGQFPKQVRVKGVPKVAESPTEPAGPEAAAK
jgi:hypothetical protein